MRRWAGGGIILSSVATRYQLGLVFHAGSLIVPLSASNRTLSSSHTDTSISELEQGVGPPLLDTMVCSAFGLQALQDIEPRQRPTGLLDQPALAQIA